MTRKDVRESTATPARPLVTPAPLVVPKRSPKAIHPTPEAQLHHLRSRAGEERERHAQEVMTFWSAFLGVPPTTLRQQLYLWLDTWGQLQVLEAMELVRQKTTQRTPSREKFQLLVRIFRDWARNDAK